LPAKYVLATLHPETSKDLGYQLKMVENFLWTIEQIPDLFVVFTHNNSDIYADSIQDKINQFVLNNPARTALFKSLGQLNYYSLVKNSTGVIGNSSSGIIEIPSFKVGTLDIGDRQKGRIASKTVIHSAIERDPLIANMQLLLSESFRHNCQTYENPYDKNGTAQSIFLEIKNADLGNIGAKDFYDIPFQ
jgi:UDP-N-acetylglucosamine 2-epimerase